MRNTSKSETQKLPPVNNIEQAFNAVWNTLYTHMEPEQPESRELRMELSGTLNQLVADGIKDPKALRRKALERMALREWTPHGILSYRVRS